MKNTWKISRERFCGKAKVSHVVPYSQCASFHCRSQVHGRLGIKIFLKPEGQKNGFAGSHILSSTAMLLHEEDIDDKVFPPRRQIGHQYKQESGLQALGIEKSLECNQISALVSYCPQDVFVRRNPKRLLLAIAGPRKTENQYRQQRLMTTKGASAGRDKYCWEIFRPCLQNCEQRCKEANSSGCYI